MKIAHYKKEFDRYRRLLVMPHSERQFFLMMGRFWLARHGFKREHKVYYGKRRHQFWSLDLAIPKRKIFIEVDSAQWHPAGNRRDILKDVDLHQRGWVGLRVTTDDMRSPRRTRHYVRTFVKDPEAFYRKYG